MEEQKIKEQGIIIKREINWNAVLKALAFIIVFNAIALGIRQIIIEFDIKIFIKESGMLEAFYSVFGVIYAIIIGLLIIEALRRYHTLQSIIEQELNAIQDIRDFLHYVYDNEDAKREIKSRLHKYVKSVIDIEWPIMREKNVKMDSDTSKQIIDLIKAVRKIKGKEECDYVALQSVMEKIADVTTYRTERLELSVEHVSQPMQLLIIFMSSIIVGGFVLMNLDCASELVHQLMICASVSAICALYFVIGDLNRPFGGVWDIKDEEFRRLRDRARADFRTLIS